MRIKKRKAHKLTIGIIFTFQVLEVESVGFQSIRGVFGPGHNTKLDSGQVFSQKAFQDLILMHQARSGRNIGAFQNRRNLQPSLTTYQRRSFCHESTLQRSRELQCLQLESGLPPYRRKLGSIGDEILDIGDRHLYESRYNCASQNNLRGKVPYM